jgi:hypothetical protein
MLRSLAGLALATACCLGAAAYAQPEAPQRTFRELLFAAYDEDRSYTLGLGVTLDAFDARRSQRFPLPGLRQAFPEGLDHVRFSVVAADYTDLFAGFPQLLATGEVLAMLSDGNDDGRELTQLAYAANYFRKKVNQACEDTAPCTAVNGEVHYAGRDEYGAHLGRPEQLRTDGLLLDDRLPVVKLKGENLQFDTIEATTLPGSFVFDGEGLRYAVGGPELRVRERVAFGAVSVGEMATATLSVRNVGESALAVASLPPIAEPAPAGGSASTTETTDFSVVSDGCGGRALAPAEGCELVLQFAPTAIGAFSGVLRIQTNDLPARIELSGTGSGVGGEVSRLAGLQVLCENVTRGTAVAIPASAASDWDCSGAGLGAVPGDTVRIVVTGTLTPGPASPGNPPASATPRD